MRILHISDLHFGAHNTVLQASLLGLAEKLKPNVILATGDLADQPTAKLLRDAKNYLISLSNVCVEAEPGAPRLLVIPGNHDRRYFGNVQVGTKRYEKFFSDIPSSFYFANHNIWIYGFDSSRFWLGANGRIAARDIYNFNAKYDSLLKEHDTKFMAAFKIVALHHHPLPINLDSRNSRWLTLANAAEFLNAVLKKEINLVVHGHEHIRARVGYVRHESRRRLDYRGSSGQEDFLERSIPVLSIGASLKLASDPETHRNSCYLLEIENIARLRIEGLEVFTSYVNCYESDGNNFDETPADGFYLESPKRASRRFFEFQRIIKGYYYSETASITIINIDGDGHRIVECHGLNIGPKEGFPIERSSIHQVSLPSTSGYVDVFHAELIPDGTANREGERLRVLEEGPSINLPQHKKRSAQYRIQFGHDVNIGDNFSYRYSWWAVNAFAMDTREASQKYSDSEWDEFEYTHFPVVDPIYALTVIVQFPGGAKSIPKEFHARVAPLSDLAKEDENFSRRLVQRKALQYYDSLHTVALRITNPLPGYSYGIKWRVPERHEFPSNPTDGSALEITEFLLKRPNIRKSQAMRAFLELVDRDIWRKLLELSDERLDVGLMVFNQEKREMVMVASAHIEGMGTRRKFSLQDYSKLDFRYGESIGGKALKANQARLYVQPAQGQKRKTPDYYLRIEGRPDHTILLCMPVQNPRATSQTYGVLCCGGYSRSSQLWQVMHEEEKEQISRLQRVQQSLNQLCFEMFKKMLEAH